MIIIFNGQNATFRNTKKLITYCRLAKDTGNTVIGFDYSGTGLKRISAWHSQTLVNDGFHLVLKTIETMDKNSKLILKGNSLGGAIAVKVAKRCHDLGIKVYLWNGRSFISISSVIAGLIQTLHLSGHYQNRITITLAALAKPIITLALGLTQLEIDVSDDYKKIPSDYKNYYIVRSKKKDRRDKKDDLVIPHCATLESDPQIKEEVKKLLAIGNKSEPTDIAYFRNRRKLISHSRRNAHPTPETKLFCRDDDDKEMSAYDLFCFFAKVYVGNHGQDEAHTISSNLEI